MTAQEYIKTLRNNLKGMSEEEKDNIVEYYTEYFEEAGMDKENEVIEELGNPKTLAIKLSGESALRSINSASTDNTSKNKNIGKTILIGIALILGSPLVLPTAIVTITLVFVFVVLVVSLGITAAAIIFAAIVGFFFGIITIFTKGLIHGIFIIGSALVSIGLGITAVLIIIGFVTLIKKIVIYFGNKKLHGGKTDE